MNPSLVHTVRAPRSPGVGAPPSIILLHGVGANETSLLSLADELDPRFQIISVRAPIEVRPGGYGFFRVQFTPEPVIVPHEAEASRVTLTRFPFRTSFGGTLWIPGGYSYLASPREPSLRRALPCPVRTLSLAWSC